MVKLAHLLRRDRRLGILHIQALPSLPALSSISVPDISKDTGCLLRAGDSDAIVHGVDEHTVL